MSGDTFQDFNNPQVRRLPAHLRKYIVDQEYERYTSLDHALWRYVMRQNYSYLKDVAYYPYIPGLKAAGLTIEKIPSLQEINDALAEIGWGAVTVDGFIPPAAFMEYQAWRVLVIAADIRTLEHIEYTPAPDIIHESAGHAPIISDVNYNRYLSHLGSVGTKAMYSRQDHELYEAIRELSILKETPGADLVLVKRAEEKLQACREQMGEPSEMALLSRLQWWTVEYGLIGSMVAPKIYGAGLLSSIGESVSCMRAEVMKIPYTIDAVNFAYDITKPQPQLFVTPDFGNLLVVLKQFESSMAASRGGAEGLIKAKASGQVCTAVLDRSLQISGVIDEVRLDDGGVPLWFRTDGPSSISVGNLTLPDGQPKSFPSGIRVVTGYLSGTSKPGGELDPRDMEVMGMKEGEKCTINFSSGISVSGILSKIIWHVGRCVGLVLHQGTALMRNGEILHEAPDGPLCLVPCLRITSVYSGAADKSVFQDDLYFSGKRTVHAAYTSIDLKYHRIFEAIRNIRQLDLGFSDLKLILDEIRSNFQKDWLAMLEIAELSEGRPDLESIYREVRTNLESKMVSQPEHRKLIADGLAIIDRKLVFA